MNTFHKSLPPGEFGDPVPRKPWTARRILWSLMGVFFVWSLITLVYDRTHTQADIVAAYPVQPGATARADALVLHGQIAQVTMHCDFESAGLSAAMLGSDAVTGYQAAKRVDGACIGMSDKLNALAIPQSLGRQVAQAYAAALDQCKSAYLDRWSVARSLEAALDTGGKVSAVADLRSSMGDWKESSRACDAALNAAPAPLGLTQGDLANAVESQPTASPVVPSGSEGGALYEGTASPAEVELIRQHQEFGSDCQTDSGPPNACALREEAFHALSKAGWCFQRPGDVGTDHTWHHCQESAGQ